MYCSTPPSSSTKGGAFSKAKKDDEDQERVPFTLREKPLQERFADEITDRDRILSEFELQLQSISHPNEFMTGWEQYVNNDLKRIQEEEEPEDEMDKLCYGFKKMRMMDEVKKAKPKIKALDWLRIMAGSDDKLADKLISVGAALAPAHFNEKYRKNMPKQEKAIASWRRIVGFLYTVLSRLIDQPAEFATTWIPRAQYADMALNFSLSPQYINFNAIGLPGFQKYWILFSSFHYIRNTSVKVGKANSWFAIFQITFLLWSGADIVLEGPGVYKDVQYMCKVLPGMETIFGTTPVKEWFDNDIYQTIIAIALENNFKSDLVTTFGEPLSQLAEEYFKLETGSTLVDAVHRGMIMASNTKQGAFDIWQSIVDGVNEGMLRVQYVIGIAQKTEKLAVSIGDQIDKVHNVMEGINVIFGNTDTASRKLLAQASELKHLRDQIIEKGGATLYDELYSGYQPSNFLLTAGSSISGKRKLDPDDNKQEQQPIQPPPQPIVPNNVNHPQSDYMRIKVRWRSMITELFEREKRKPDGGDVMQYIKLDPNLIPRTSQSKTILLKGSVVIPHPDMIRYIDSTGRYMTKPNFNDIFLKISLPSEYDNSLLVEKAIYSEICEKFLENKVIPHVIGGLLTMSIGIREFTGMNLALYKDILAGFGLKTYDGKINVLITDKSIGVPLSDVMDNKKISSDDLVIIFYQVFRTLYVFGQEGLVHHDLHHGNILVETFDEPYELAYHDEPLHRIYKTRNKHVIKIFDFDRSSIYHPLIERNIMNDSSDRYHSIPNSDKPIFDVAGFLCSFYIFDRVNYSILVPFLNRVLPLPIQKLIDEYEQTLMKRKDMLYTQLIYSDEFRTSIAKYNSTLRIKSADDKIEIANASHCLTVLEELFPHLIQSMDYGEYKRLYPNAIFYSSLGERKVLSLPPFKSHVPPSSIIYTSNQMIPNDVDLEDDPESDIDTSSRNSTPIQKSDSGGLVDIFTSDSGLFSKFPSNPEGFFSSFFKNKPDEPQMIAKRYKINIIHHNDKTTVELLIKNASKILDYVVIEHKYTELYKKKMREFVTTWSNLDSKWTKELRTIDLSFSQKEKALELYTEYIKLRVNDPNDREHAKDQELAYVCYLLVCPFYYSISSPVILKALERASYKYQPPNSFEKRQHFILDIFKRFNGILPVSIPVLNHVLPISSILEPSTWIESRHINSETSGYIFGTSSKVKKKGTHSSK